MPPVHELRYDETNRKGKHSRREDAKSPATEQHHEQGCNASDEPRSDPGDRLWFRRSSGLSKPRLLHSRGSHATAGEDDAAVFANPNPGESSRALSGTQPGGVHDRKASQIVAPTAPVSWTRCLATRARV
jgi:hypothetical protein